MNETLSKYTLNESFLKEWGFEPVGDQSFRNKEARISIHLGYGGKFWMYTYAYDEQFNRCVQDQMLVSEFKPESDEDLLFLFNHIVEFRRRIDLTNKSVEFSG
jgi:hypothetical protein